MKNIDELLQEIKQKARSDRKSFHKLTLAMSALGQYDLVAELNKISDEIYRDTDETKVIKARAKLLSSAFKMAGMSVPESTCWLIDEIIKIVNEKGDKFSIEDAISVDHKTFDLFVFEPLP